MIENIRLYLTQTITEPIFIGFRPAKPDTSITLFQTSGFPPDAKHQYTNIGMQVNVVSSQYETSKALADTIFDRLQSVPRLYSPYLIDIVTIEALQNPFSIGRDELNRALFVQNYRVEYFKQTSFRS